MEEFLTESTVKDNIRRIVALFTTTDYDDITMEFDLKTGIDKAEPDYFNTMIADALSMHFGVSVEPEDVAQFNTVQDIVDKAENN